jgi:two-component system sensor histidine kinase RpfC
MKQGMMPPPSPPLLEVLLNQQALNRLAKLCTGKEFIRDLVEGFRRDGEVLLKELDAASEAQDYLRFREALHALKGSATELGGVELVKLCEASERLRPYDMGSTEPANKVAEISNSFSRIAEAVASHLTLQREIK